MPGEFSNPSYIDPGLAADVSGFLATAAADATAKVAAEAASRGAADAGLAATIAAGVNWSAVSGKPSTFAPAAHTHAQADVTSLTAALAAKADDVHTHAQADVVDLIGDLAAKADDVHTHAQSDVTDLDTTLADLVASIAGAGGTPLLRTVAQGPPVNAVSSEFLTNQTIRIATTSAFSLPGGTTNWSNEDYVFTGYNSGTGAGRWQLSANKSIYWDAGYWYISSLGFFGLVLLRAAGAFDANPASLTYAQAPGSEASGGGITLTAIPGTFAGDTGTASAYLFQPCIVGDAGGPYQVFVSTCLSPTRWFPVPNANDVLAL